MTGARSDPFGVVLAGGAGRRLGGAKATAPLAGRPLAAWVVGAMGEAFADVAVVAKPTTALPSFEPTVAVWREPEEPLHPLAGIAWALFRAGGRPVVVCAVDLPFVEAETLRTLAAASGEVAIARGQPLLGRYGPLARRALESAMGAGRAARETVTGLDPLLVEVAEAELVNVNTPADLAAAEAVLTRG